MRRREGRSRRAARVRRAVTVGLLLTTVPLTTVGAPTVASAADSDKERDVQLVYCLDASHRTGLAAAGVRLGLLKPGATAFGTVQVTGKRAAPMTLTQWAGLRKDDFGRSCDALMAAESESPGSAAPKEEDGWLATLLVSLPLLVVGSVLTLFVQTSDRIVSERRQFATRLESARQTFRSAARLYLAAYELGAPANHTDLLPAREALNGAFAAVTGSRARRAAARALADQLPLAQRLPENQNGATLTPGGRRHLADQVRQTMDQQLSQVSDLNRTFVYWWWRALRGSSTGSGA